MKTLLIPIHIDAMRLNEPLSVRNPTANYSRMPFNDGEKDINSGTPPISEAILSDPFEPSNLTLPKGLHLHWALPDGLTRGVHTIEGTRFCSVPNRWLITKLDKNKKILKQWVVESDFIHPTNSQSSVVTLPFISKSSNYPYRNIGRELPIEIWKQHKNEGEHLPRLTAVGFEPNVDIKKLPSFSLGWQESEYGTIYREPTFAAYYPNCYSIFGTYENFKGSLKDCTYEVIGWYSNQKQDSLEEIRENAKKIEHSKKTEIEKQIKIANEEFGWEIEGELPSQSLYFGRITFNSDENPEHPDKLSEDFSISIADSSIEALSAYLAEGITKEPKDKEQFEEQFEVLNLQDNLNDKKLDLTAQIRKVRHTDRFSPVQNNSKWEVKLISKSELSNSNATSTITIPSKIYKILKELNELQEEYDNLKKTITSLKERTFADWYKYLLCAYSPMESQFELPNSDIVKYFIENRDLIPLENLEAKRKNLFSEKTQKNNLLKSEIDNFNTQESVKKVQMECKLYQSPAPRYWLPNEPVVMLESKSCIATDRHGQDKSMNSNGLLKCIVFDINESSIEELLENNYNLLKDKIDRLEKDNRGAKPIWRDNFPFKNYSHKPWNPLLFDWRVRLYPLRNNTNARSEDRNFDMDLIEKNYELKLDKSDFRIKNSEKVTLALNSAIYSGSSIITASTAEYFKNSAKEYLKKHFPNAPFDDEKKLKEFYKKECSKEISIEKMLKNPKYSIFYAYMQMLKGRFLSQVLSGFNDALLMQKLTMQVPVSDPLEFKEHTDFYKRVKKDLEVGNFNAPQPLNDFFPLRTGGIKLTDLRLVDTFGRTKDIKIDKITKPERMSDKNSPNLVMFPPRFMQPLKVNFRFLSASSQIEESDSTKENSPICGWLLVNHFGSRLMVYDENGNSLGSLIVKNSKVKWDYAPGNIKVNSNNIKNLHLREVVKFLENASEEIFNNYLDSIENALESIEPSKIETSDSMAFLIGRPLAIVRTKLNLEIAGLPAIHLGWDALKSDMKRQTRSTDDFTNVTFPIRIGEYKELNDGLVGYFIESENGFKENTFYSLQDSTSDSFDSNLKIKTLKDNENLNIYKSLSSKDTFLTMLLDPRGSIHASAGLVPTKDISIPETLYSKALDNFYVTFLVSSIISDENRLRVPLPETPEFTWTWLEKQSSGEWLEVPVIQLIEKSKFSSELVNEVVNELREKENREVTSEDKSYIKSEAEKLWSQLNSEKFNWLSKEEQVPMEGDWSSIVSKDERKKATFEGVFENKEKLIQKVLDLHYIGLQKEDSDAKFTGQKILREGWLKLTPTNSKSKIK